MSGIRIDPVKITTVEIVVVTCNGSRERTALEGLERQPRRAFQDLYQ